MSEDNPIYRVADDTFNNLGEIQYGDYDYSDYPNERQWIHWWYVNVWDIGH